MQTLTLMVLFACGEPEEEAVPEDISLIDPEAWVLLDASEDPWQDSFDGNTDCSTLGYEVEGSYFEVDTELCPYGTFSQPALHGVSEGDPITIVYWHLDLWSTDKDAEGHVAISIGGEVLVDDALTIPADAEVHPTETTAPRDIEAGESITFHLHNHGYNSWSMGTFEAFTLP